MAKDEYEDATLAIDITEATTGVTHGTPIDTETISFATPKPVPGTVSLNIEPEGEEFNFYADNGPYYSVTTNNGYTGEMEIAIMPDEQLIDLLGNEVDNNGMLVEVADGKQKAFALLIQVDGNVKNRRTVYYNCKVSRPSTENTTTEEGIEVATETYPLVIQPIELNGKKITKGRVELLNTPSAGNTAMYNNFFTVVQLPVFGE
ncbi:phage tail protein [Proteiniclasticum sp. BAD-10]|uniref:Phage tail protein n=2 Tax=Proteiniclasticum sediminis TaxID=2804028 RepID=A0A941CPZ0_9CLOT|nr:phage tail protein [Proteiniclasticum sediminis]